MTNFYDESKDGDTFWRQKLLSDEHKTTVNCSNNLENCRQNNPPLFHSFLFFPSSGNSGYLWDGQGIDDKCKNGRPRKKHRIFILKRGAKIRNKKKNK